ncbi:MAG: methylmalonyl Co-A mutase-associated GTPase MeaB [Bacteroidetes bacterium]|nr:methylmalonyl Co-A mutase-associated GTPase MeaB [Bacteroidia bacterium]MBN4052347.1 methylmalonyl Co-A mutase-associated GTPase MeaB [Sphingobacteriaceae bacterium AH-315-L07]PCH68578.1 MAG: methylmalonyl Co-A mutase-associated GTPase MeaB [Bacteroidota bacterium]
MSSEIENLLSQLHEGNNKALARSISIVENETDGHQYLLENLKINHSTSVIGLTGPPGAGKSTLVNCILSQLATDGKKVGVIAIDPTSPFNLGSLLGDRVRMSNHFNDENIFIRSLATRGSLGGLSAKTIEVVDIMKSAGFDQVIVETVGVGQSEIEIIGLADTTVLVLVPESGDEIQTLKSGIMEIADIFVVNKAERDGADAFVKNLHNFLKDKSGNSWKPSVVKAIATQNSGIEELLEQIQNHQKSIDKKDNSIHLFTEKAYKLIQNNRMKDVNRSTLKASIESSINKDGFNLYSFVNNWDK